MPAATGRPPEVCSLCWAAVAVGTPGCGRCGARVAREAAGGGAAGAAEASLARRVAAGPPLLRGRLSDSPGTPPAWSSDGDADAALFGLHFDAALAADLAAKLGLPAQPLPLVPAPPRPLPPAADDPRLTADARLLFVRAFSDLVPRHSAAPFHPPAFRAFFLRGSGPGSAPADGWFARTHADPLLMDALCWIGARLVRAGIYPGTFVGSYSHAHDLNGTVRALQRRVQRRIAEGLGRFWAEAADAIVSTGAVTGERLRTPENLALMLSLTVCAILAFWPMGQVVTARHTLAHVARMWEHTGIEGGGRGGGAFNLTPQDWLRREHWVRLFWVAATFELTLAAGSETPPSFDVLHFPDVPLPATDEAFHSVMPSPRAGDPPMAELLAQAPPFRAREFFVWMDPKDGPSFPPGARTAVLARCVADLDRSRTTFMPSLACYLLSQVHAFWKWASESASLSPLDVLVGEHLLSLGATASSVPLPLRAAGISEADAARLLSHPHLPAAVSRLLFLRGALAAHESALSAPLLAPDPLACPLPASFDSMQKHRLLAHLASVRLAGMLLNSPGPPDQLALHAPPAVLAAWSALPAFSAATDRALRVSATMRALLSRFSRAEHARDLQLPSVCSAASHAAAFHALLLRRGAGGPEEEFAACIGVLRASGWPGAAEAAEALEGLAAGREVEMGREVVLMAGEAADEDGDGEGA
ncbi:hypothetical protein DFJ74DRAFT_757514 [Hyaloraphidium curvatum]|nr:hypothetical protein DFJ74DRAFT_757514 [Hyaloraphidium curvatum]